MSENKHSHKKGGGPFGPHGNMSGEKPADFKGTLKKLLGYIKDYRIGLLFVLIFAVASTVFNIVGPKRVGDATTELFEGIGRKFSGTGEINFGNISEILFGVLILYIVAAVFSLIMGLIMTEISQKIGYKMRRDLIKKINRLPMNYFDKRQTGDVLSVVTNDVDTLTMGLNQSATQFITSAATIIGILYMMFSINWIMTLVAILSLPISLGIIGVIMKKSQKHFTRQQNHLGDVNGQVEETFSGLNIVQAFNHQDKDMEKFEKSNKKLFDSAWKSQFYSGMMMPIMQFLSNLSYVAICILGGVFYINGYIQFGNIQSFIQYTRQFTQPVQQLATVSSMAQSIIASAERIFKLLDEAEEEQLAENHATLTETANGNKVTRNVIPADIGGDVKFENVHFGYDPEKIIINDFSASVKKDQMVAIVGPTGGGKTTIVKLLMRFYDLQSGKITIDGNDINDFDRSELRSVFGMVLQDTWLFSGTIMENIRYGKLDATDEEVFAAAKAAHAHRFIKTLPEGYDTVLNEDATNISQGQKQLLTIARTILSDPQIMILDEATSSVDTRTEMRIQKAMKNLIKQRTSFIIAHRLSTIRDADIILVLNKGDIVEQGSHDELLAKKGFYAELYNSQFENAS